MSLVKTYPLEEALICALERRHFALSGLAALLQQFTLQTECPIDRERYDQLLGEYLDAFTEKELLLQSVYRAMVAPEFLDEAYYTQEVRFATKEIRIYEREDTPHGTNCRTCHH